MHIEKYWDVHGNYTLLFFSTMTTLSSVSISLMTIAIGSKFK